MAAADKAAAKWQEEAELAQRVVTKNADATQARVDDADRWDQQRADIAAKLGTAQGVTYDLAGRIASARALLDQQLRAGNTEAAASHGAALGSMALTLQRAQGIVEQLQNDWQSVPQSDVTPDERASLPLLRKIAANPTKSHAHVVPPLTPDPASELRALGRRVRENPAAFVNTALPIRDTRHA